MRAESNHKRSLLASKNKRILLPTLALFVAGFACIVMGVASLTLASTHTNLINVQGASTQLSISQLLAFVNAKRQEMGIAPLIVHPALEQAAAQKAAHMVERGYWDHSDPSSGVTPWQFIDAAGYRYAKAGENLARDFEDSQLVVDAWMASPSHKANMLEREYTHTGIGIAYGILDEKPTVLVVQLMATPLVAGARASTSEFMATPAVTPQSLITVLLFFFGGVLTASIGLALLVLSRKHKKIKTFDHQGSGGPPLHLWST
jgi:uncharacterized protein YkwD